MTATPDLTTKLPTPDVDVWPLLSFPEIGHPAIAQAAGDYTAMADRLRDARALREELENGLPDAIDADQRALADALRAGKPDPGETAAESHRRKLWDAMRHEAAAEIAVAAALSDLAKVCDRHGDEYADTVRGRVDRSRAKLAKLLDQVAGVHADLAAGAAMLSWLDGMRSSLPRSVYTPGKHESTLVGLRRVTREDGDDGGITVADALDQLADLTLAPDERPQRRPGLAWGPGRQHGQEHAGLDRQDSRHAGPMPENAPLVSRTLADEVQAASDRAMGRS